MRYSVQERLMDGYRVIVLRDDATDSEAAIVPDIGANLIRCRLHGDEWIEAPPDLLTLRRQSSEFGTPLLWPPGRVRHGVYRFHGREYHLPLNEGINHLHGELRHLPWEAANLYASDSQGASITLRFHTDQSSQVSSYYPHAIALRATYLLQDGALTGTLEAVNESRLPAPFGFGLHPYFALRGESGRWQLKLPVGLLYDMNARGIVTEPPHSDALCLRLGEGMRLDELPKDRDYYLFRCVDGARKCILERTEGMAGDDRGSGDACRLVLTFSKSFPYLALFRPSWANAISIEPWSCITDAFQSPLPEPWTGAAALLPGECREFRWLLQTRAS